MKTGKTINYETRSGPDSGQVRNGIFTKHATLSDYSDKLVGYMFPESLIDRLIDEGVNEVVIVDANRGRYCSSVEDWQEFGIVGDGDVHLAQARMSHG